MQFNIAKFAKALPHFEADTPEIQAVLAFNSVFPPGPYTRAQLSPEDLNYVNFIPRLLTVPVMRGTKLQTILAELKRLLKTVIDEQPPHLLVKCADDLRTIGDRKLAGVLEAYLDQQRPRQYRSVWFVRGLARRIREDPSARPRSVLIRALVSDTERGQLEQVLALAATGACINVVSPELVPSSAVKIAGSRLAAMLPMGVLENGLYLNYRGSEELISRFLIRSRLSMNDIPRPPASERRPENEFLARVVRATSLIRAKKISADSPGAIFESLLLSGRAFVDRGILCLVDSRDE